MTFVELPIERAAGNRPLTYRALDRCKMCALKLRVGVHKDQDIAGRDSGAGVHLFSTTRPIAAQQLQVACARKIRVTPRFDNDNFMDRTERRQQATQIIRIAPGRNNDTDLQWAMAASSAGAKTCGSSNNWGSFRRES